MLFSVFIPLLLAAGSTRLQVEAKQITPITHANSDAQSYSIVPGAFIIQTDAGLNLNKRDFDSKVHLAKVLASVAGRLKGGTYSVRQTFTGAPSIFHGASIQVNASTTTATLQAIPGVQRVWPVRSYPRPQTVLASDQSPAKPQPISAGDLINGINPSSYPSGVTPINTGGKVRRATLPPGRPGTIQPGNFPYSPDTFPPHVMGGVDQAHAAKQLGAGIKVAVIDSGVDYSHPFLGAGFGAGKHISFGYDLVGDAYTGANSPVPDNDPFVNCDEHGTHVTGIVGALSNGYGFSGVAPSATLGHYRVFGCTGSVNDDVLMAALLRGQSDGVNLMTMSLGGPGGWIGNSAVELLIDAFAAQSPPIHVTVAQGNEGSEGLYYASSPASAKFSYSVGSIDATQVPGYNMVVGPNKGSLPYLATVPFNATSASVSYPVYFTSNDPAVTNDACSPLPAGTPNLANYVTVVYRGTCTFVTKYQNVLNAGGKMILVVNGASSTSLVYLDPSGVAIRAVALLRRQDGLALFNIYKANPTGTTLTFPRGALVNTITDSLNGGVISDFSSFGPTFDMYGQPTLAAPGGNILSTFPLALGGLGTISGTSMATPYIAGCVAVLLGARSSEALTPVQVRSLLATTSKLSTVSVGGGAYQTALLQGGGLVQLPAAIAAKTFIQPYSLFLNDTAHPALSQPITLTNKNTYTVTYTFKNVAGQTRGLYDSSTILPAENPPVINSAATVVLPTAAVTIAAGASLTINAIFTPPAATAQYPFYSGWIQVTGTGNGASQVFNVAYYGLASSLSAAPVLDTTDTIYGDGAAYPFIADSTGNIVNSATTTFPAGMGPIIYFRLAMGSPNVIIDLLDGASTFRGTIPTSNNGGPARRDLSSRFQKRATTTSYASVATLGNIAKYSYSPRDAFNSNTATADIGGYSDNEIPFNGVYTNSMGVITTAAKNTQYRILLRAQQIATDSLAESSYQSWVSEPFSFV